MNHLFQLSLACCVVVVVAAAGCAVDPDDLRMQRMEIIPVGPPMNGLHVVGNHIRNAAGRRWCCAASTARAPSTSASTTAGSSTARPTSTSIRAIASWKINAVRVPLNEDVLAGDRRRRHRATRRRSTSSAIHEYVGSCSSYHIVPILDLHWVGPGTRAGRRLQPMPDADHALDFWTDVATTFADDDARRVRALQRAVPGSQPRHRRRLAVLARRLHGQPVGADAGHAAHRDDLPGGRDAGAGRRRPRRPGRST